MPNAPNEEDEGHEEHEAIQEGEGIGVASTSSQTVTVEITTPPKRKARASRKKRRRGSGDDFSASDDDEEVDPSKYGRATFSHKKRASAMQPGKIDFCHVCSQRFTITAYTKTSPDGEGLLCHKCGAVEQAKDASVPRPKRNRMKLGKGHSKMLQEGKDDWIGTLQDACIKATPWSRYEVDRRLLRSIYMMLRRSVILEPSTWIKYTNHNGFLTFRFVRLFRGIGLLIMILSHFSFDPISRNCDSTIVPASQPTRLNRSPISHRTFQPSNSRIAAGSSIPLLRKSFRACTPSNI